MLTRLLRRAALAATAATAALVAAACAIGAPSPSPSSASLSSSSPSSSSRADAASTSIGANGDAPSEPTARPRDARAAATCAPTFDVCAEGQIVSILDAMANDHGWGFFDDAHEPAAEREIRLDWQALRFELGATFAGVAPLATAHAEAIARRADDFTDAGAWLPPVARRGDLLVAREILVGVEELARIDALLAPSAHRDAVRARLADVRSTVATQLDRLLAAERQAGRPCGDAAGLGLGDEAACGSITGCAPPAIAACATPQILAILAGEADAMTRLANLEQQLGADARAVSVARAMRDEAATLRGALPLPPLPNPPENDLAFVPWRTSILEVSFDRTVVDAPSAAIDRAFVRYEIPELLQAIGLVDHLLAPSARDMTVATALRRFRASLADDLTALVALDAAYDGACGGATAPIDAGASDAAACAP